MSYEVPGRRPSIILRVSLSWLVRSARISRLGMDRAFGNRRVRRQRTPLEMKIRESIRQILVSSPETSLLMRKGKRPRATPLGTPAGTWVPPRGRFTSRALRKRGCPFLRSLSSARRLSGMEPAPMGRAVSGARIWAETLIDCMMWIVSFSGAEGLVGAESA